MANDDDLPTLDAAGDPIDWVHVFASAAELWRLPSGVTLWTDLGEGRPRGA